MDNKNFPFEDWEALSLEEQVAYVAAIKAMRYMIALEELVMKTAFWILVLVSVAYIIVMLVVPLPQTIVFIGGGVLFSVWVTVFLLTIFRRGK